MFLPADVNRKKQQREIGSLLGASYLILGNVSLQGLAKEHFDLAKIEQLLAEGKKWWE